MRRLQLHSLAANGRRILTPVKLEGLARLEYQRNESAAAAIAALRILGDAVLLTHGNNDPARLSLIRSERFHAAMMRSAEDGTRETDLGNKIALVLRLF